MPILKNRRDRASKPPSKELVEGLADLLVEHRGQMPTFAEAREMLGVSSEELNEAIDYLIRILDES